MKNIAVILAGGAGKRFGGDKPKQLLPLEDGRSVLEHAVDAFRQCECIDEVVVVMDPHLAPPTPLKGEVTFVPNGRERWESSWNALLSLSPSSGREDGNWEQKVNVLIHDAARPFVSKRIIEDVCKALEKYEAVTVAVPSTDTVYRSPFPACEQAPLPRQEAGERFVAEIPDRATMLRAQTPQAFRLELIKRAYEIAVQDPNLQATDDCGIVHKYLPETPIYIVEGEEANRKITFKGDL